MTAAGRAPGRRRRRSSTRVVDDHVRGQHRHAAGDGPGVQVVDVDHAPQPGCARAPGPCRRRGCRPRAARRSASLSSLRVRGTISTAISSEATASARSPAGERITRPRRRSPRPSRGRRPSPRAPRRGSPGRTRPRPGEPAASAAFASRPTTAKTSTETGLDRRGVGEAPYSLDRDQGGRRRAARRRSPPRRGSPAAASRRSVWWSAGGRRTRPASRVSPTPAASEAMWAASASSARLPVTRPPTTCTPTKARAIASTTASRPR